MIFLEMPALSPTMKEGKIAKWHIKEGDKLKGGELLAEIETDKALMEWEAVEVGIVGKILIPQSRNPIPVNTPLVALLEEGDDPSLLENLPTPSLTPKGEDVSTDTPAPTVSAVSKERSSSTPKVQDASMDTPDPTVSTASKERIFASPLAKRLAKEAGISLASLTGSGPGGRIVKRDVLASSSVTSQKIELSGMQQVIAERMTHSKTHVPHFYLTRSVFMEKLMALREQVNEGREKPQKISLNDAIIKAVVLALKEHPSVNVQWEEGYIRQFQSIDVACAVAVEDGLMTPVIKNAHGKTLFEISKELKVLVQKARDRKLSPEQYQGGAFTVSNLGMFGVETFYAIINEPQGAILSVGAVLEKPVSIEGHICSKPVMSVSLSLDHRCINGTQGAAFLETFSLLIERRPFTLFLS